MFNFYFSVTQEKCGVNGLVIEITIVLYYRSILMYKNCFDDENQIAEYVSYNILPIKPLVLEPYWQLQPNGIFFRLKYGIDTYYRSTVIENTLFKQMGHNDWYGNGK